MRNDQIEIQIMISSTPQSEPPCGSCCRMIVSVLKYNQVVGHSYGQQFHFVSGTIYINEMISISGSKLICKCGEGCRGGQMVSFGDVNDSDSGLSLVGSEPDWRLIGRW